MLIYKPVYVHIVHLLFQIFVYHVFVAYVISIYQCNFTFQVFVYCVDPLNSILIFTITRSQAERWFQALSFAEPDCAMALHHGSIAMAERQAIEAGIKSGDLKWVICTSSLDLGVDFHPVERIVQIGSAKNLARLLQRAGRSAHQPGGTSDVFFQPTNALELVEIAAFRPGLAAGDNE